MNLNPEVFEPQERQRLPCSLWARLLAASEPWGRLCFLDHRDDSVDAMGVYSWIPDIEVPSDPEAWHPEDALFAPLYAGDGSLLETALREAEEEIDLSSDLVEVVGRLEEMYIPPSNFLVSPFVGLLPPAAEMVLAPDEVEAIFTVSLVELMSPETLRRVPWRRDGRDYQVPIFAVGGSPSRNIWGATAAMTASLLVRLGWRGYRSLAGE